MFKHQSRGVQKRFILSMVFTTLILVAEIIGGLISGSLALLSDAAHVFMDLFALALSLVALKLASLPPDDKHSFGWHRLEVFAALVNGLTLLAIAIGIWAEAVQRWKNPVTIQSTEMLVIAIIGLVVNLIVALILGGQTHRDGEHHHKHSEVDPQKETSVRKDLNLNSAFLHVLGDAISSVGVILAAILIKITNLSWIDPLVSILIGFIIISSSYRVLRGALRILVEGVPEGLSIKEINQTIVNISGIVSVHDLHVWSICSGAIALSAHVVLDQRSTMDRVSKMEQIKEALVRRYQIEHTTIQFEDYPCMNGQGGCN